MTEANTQQTSVKKILPLILATAIFMQMLDSTILNTSLPAIAKDLNESPLNMQNAIISYVLTLAVFMPASGFLADRFGTKKIFIFSLVLFSLGSLFCSLSQNLTHLVISRVVQGVGGSLMTPVGKLALIKTFDKNELLKAMNFAIIPALIGPVLGPLVGGYMVDYLSWHWIFLINIPIGVLGIVLGLKFMPNYKSDDVDFDLKGFLIFAAASLLLSVSLELFGDIQNITPVLLVFIMGFLFLYYYYKHAKRGGNPIFPLNLFQVRTFRVGIVGNLATRLGISSVPLLLPLMIQIAYKQSAVTSGWIIAPMALTAIFGKSSVIKILDKYGYRQTLMVNTFIIGTLICLLAIPDIHTSLYWFVPIIAILGFFNSIQFTSMNTISIADLRNFQTSSGNSLISVNQQLAIGFGIAFGLIVLKLFENTDLINGEIHNAFRLTFLTVGILTILSGLVFRRLHISDGKNMQSKEE
ncbi:EmrB/QacA subfamily drug resistance transporter [Chryseobacterium bernardetii]|jgi:EmrB/QacA subfamily drug resistance transporter|uniref:EmrB/QacA subfamily drug resistance transporter n=3 Tax=Chryseobacterium TaxID=59732 RepID=A0A543E9X9_9FLAO|nr:MULTISPECIES: MFS transporter [Chryseobacterium]MDR6371903.1 EmrB/QacA subfamily drug resistance transporter [Chryseobacterium vietnamense]MDR6443835.1 EmrB/QacA subfamily drug resistance transporter [Chryseobacterium bernardetii]MDR6460872.1 EmrB/QacA subfamily drug resistance transporter [Chryseobacterium vietnamense]MDR6488431.1 EmrB/QacA subfamily drug resistance transporter [Chryseobacterium vietnamense]TQM18393.1 EmrB/QacA subfamily drug resistance transporter [Chryseobacterium aquifr